MKSTINVTAEHLEGIIKELDSNKYFLLNNEDASRTELFNFALALGLKEGTPTKLSTSKSFIRTSYDDIKSSLFAYKSIYYENKLTNGGKIDDIKNIDAILELVEEYANTGFYIIAKMKSQFPDDYYFTLKLLNEIESIRDEMKEYKNASKDYPSDISVNNTFDMTMDSPEDEGFYDNYIAADKY